MFNCAARCSLHGETAWILWNWLSSVSSSATCKVWNSVNNLLSGWPDYLYYNLNCWHHSSSLNQISNKFTPFAIRLIFIMLCHISALVFWASVFLMFPILSSEYIPVSFVRAACLTHCKYFDLATWEIQREVYDISSFPVMHSSLLKSFGPSICSIFVYSRTLCFFCGNKQWFQLFSLQVLWIS